ncbi:4'-phosphopantetheinyl transferase superfamily protein [Glaciimonas sp. PAMC28666]|uniref:4'-phosphopantetheinyl transferase family protein n=1 Tax=Glaciimonas sp. PAMC28666 TaxID=2807626 RepID=UPI0019638F34|nr:4'-phosphopantetheinyl transferase superfamily protein [Glaciimonas sp. PAMC28666]QRX82745.1 4'-phosphopantetheinyl transferase superfamily protein [Glaciimonas sp. PAMC28666]
MTEDTDGLKSPLIVISVITPLTSIRDSARERIRIALREALGFLLNMSPLSVPLVTELGQPIRLALPALHLGLSLSHEPGLSVAAINLRGKVGIDLMRVNAIADWRQVAQDYLGHETVKRIADLPSSGQSHAFAQEWTRYEACLKCLDIGIREWDPSLDIEMRQCIVNPLILPNGMVGTVATLPAIPPHIK